MKWPVVWDEDKTIDAVLSGMSIARFGDGEFNLAVGGNCITQKHSAKIQSSLRDILLNPGKCLVGIPRLDGPKKKFWQQYCRHDILSLFGRNSYASAFITRPDSAPNIDRDDYWNKIRRIWSRKKVTLVRGSEKSLTADMLDDTIDVREIVVPKKNAFEYASRPEFKIGNGSDIVILCCGPAATVLAYALNISGFHAVDLGHIGMFLRKHIRREPMIVTKEDKAVDRV